jgi:hypothetical protein
LAWVAGACVIEITQGEDTGWWRWRFFGAGGKNDGKDEKDRKEAGHGALVNDAA